MQLGSFSVSPPRGGRLLRTDASVLADCAGNLVQQVVRSAPVGLSLEVQDDAVPQGRLEQGMYIFPANVEPTVQKSAHFSAHDQSLGPAWRTSIANVFVGQCTTVSVSMSSQHQANHIILHV